MSKTTEDELPGGLGLSGALEDLGEEKTELDKIMEMLLDPKNIHHNTELTPNEQLAFSVLGTLAKKYDLEVVRDFLKENLLYRVSRGRKGRSEWVKILSNYGRNTAEAEMSAGKPGRFFRGRR